MECTPNLHSFPPVAGERGIIVMEEHKLRHLEYYLEYCYEK